MSKFRNKVPHASGSIVVIKLYPLSDSSQWPFPIPIDNRDKFQEAMDWLLQHNIPVKGTVYYGIRITQTVKATFTNQIDMLAFTLQFGDCYDSFST